MLATERDAKTNWWLSVQSGPLFRQPDVARGCCYHEPHQAGHALAAVEELILPHFLSSAALAHEGQVFPLLGERVQRVEMGKWAKTAGVLWALRQTPRRHPVTRPRGLTSRASCLRPTDRLHESGRRPS
jgi:hypothetical protein